MLAHRKTIEGFIQYRDKRQENDLNSPWKDITSYTETEFDDFEAHVLSNTTIPPAPGKNSIADDKALETWIRGKRTKTAFTVLKVDTAYIVGGNALSKVEVAYQGFTNVIDPKFKPGNLTGTARDLYELQQIYAWSVFLEVFKNPLGITSLSPFLIPPKMHVQPISIMKNSKCYRQPTPLTSTKSSKKLSSMKVVEYNGTKVDFVVEFFEVLNKSNAKSPNPTTPIIGYPVTNALFLGLQGEPNLVRQFDIQLAPTGNDVVDIENMKNYFLHSAGLGDGQDELDKMKTLTNYSRSNTTTKVKALVHDFGIAEESQDEAAERIEAYMQRFQVNRTYHAPDPAT